MPGRRVRRRASLKPNKANRGCMFYHPGESKLVLSKQQLRNQRRGTTPARLPGLPGTEKHALPLCLTLFEVCGGACHSEDEPNAPSL